ncbi:Txe/YoeB family addiction module toxin [Acetobacter thailandicus]|uniref:Putative mRNA interferase YoeB n=1 Tax=Acetobacter thailandicus TaxID=1502842 RepID=A0ABT3QHN9_9PROT|nr:Txe/YoeB family addiction module toxin [Acetobacter thailandicus]MCX2564793.1 Txe/YoeB family addiction module toxin [Acetobacter thailandicus]NHN96307.1 Txe/YoeB family addiction module toxin [Acetobacter thailandicus]
MKVFFHEDGWEDYLSWLQSDTAVLEKINALIEDVRRHPFQGLGKPEPLKGQLSGWWSRRITGEHRLVYRVQGRSGDDQRVEIVQCRFHY